MLQDRLALFAKCVFLLAGGFWLLLHLSYLILFGNPIRLSGEGPLSWPSAFHFSATVVAGVMWFLTARSPLSRSALLSLDAGGTIAVSLLLAGSGSMQIEPTAGAYTAMLTTACAVITRAVLVPSPAKRTLAISAVCGLAVPPLAAFAFLRHDTSGVPLALAVVNGALWSTVAVVIASVASKVIFGLRQTAREANRVGQYTLEERIGEGAMGEVWRARHALLRRPAAIKLLRVEKHRDEAIRRFEREVQLTAGLTHPNTVAVFDYGRTADGVFYYAMELLDGLDLERVVEFDGPQPPERVIHVLAQVCDALSEAHDVGLVHRDVKPANILLSVRGGVPDVAKVVDFGLAKLVDRSPAITRTGANIVAGTPMYMSPEAITDPAAVDARSDLYAVGAVGWFLLAGRAVFTGKSLAEVCSKHLHEAPQRPSHVLGRDLPADLEALVLRCLEKDPKKRPQSALEVRGALLACEHATAWTRERAAYWWQGVGELPSQRRAAEGAERTLAIDLRRRAGR